MLNDSRGMRRSEGATTPLVGPLSETDKPLSLQATEHAPRTINPLHGTCEISRLEAQKRVGHWI
jgi:hypothetical protein